MFNFPDTPTVGQQVTAANGIVYKYDGTKWASVAGGSAIATGAVPPSAPAMGQLWWDTVGGQLYIYYNDGNSSQWVSANGMPSSNLSPVLVSPPPSANWTQRNFAGSTTLTDVSTGVKLLDTTGVGATNIRAASIVVPATPYVIDANFGSLGLVLSGSGFAIGLGWMDGTKYQLGICQAVGNTANFGEILVVGYSNATTFASVSSTVYYGPVPYSNIWIRIADNGTTVSWSASHNGIDFLLVYSVAKASGYLGSSGYTNAVFSLDANMGAGATGQVVLKSWWAH